MTSNVRIHVHSVFENEQLFWYIAHTYDRLAFTPALPSFGPYSSESEAEAAAARTREAISAVQ